MNNLRIGQKVVCIDDDWGPMPVDMAGHVQRWPKKDDVYTVRTIDVEKSTSKVFIRLHEIVNPESDKDREAEFWAECFRPVVERETDIAIFEKMLDGSRVLETTVTKG